MTEDDVLRVRDYLEHIELAIARIRRYLAGLDRTSFLASEEKQDAVIRNIEIIGEAAQSIRRRHPEFAARHLRNSMGRRLWHEKRHRTRIFHCGPRRGLEDGLRGFAGPGRAGSGIARHSAE